MPFILFGRILTELLVHSLLPTTFQDLKIQYFESYPLKLQLCYFKKEVFTLSALQNSRPSNKGLQSISHCFIYNLLVKAKCLYCICSIIFRSYRTWVKYKHFPGWIFTIGQIKWVTSLRILEKLEVAHEKKAKSNDAT